MDFAEVTHAYETRRTMTLCAKRQRLDCLLLTRRTYYNLPRWQLLVFRYVDCTAISRTIARTFVHMTSDSATLPLHYVSPLMKITRRTLDIMQGTVRSDRQFSAACILLSCRRPAINMLARRRTKREIHGPEHASIVISTRTSPVVCMHLAIYTIENE